MGAQRKDGVFHIAGIVGLLGLLLFVFWTRSTDRNTTGVQNTDNASGKSAINHAHDDPTHHGHDMVTAKLSRQSKSLLPIGNVANGVREITYEAFQYGFDPDPLIVRAGEKIRLFVKSRDVEHGMMIPEVDFNTPMPIGKAKTVEFTAPSKPGEYPVFCSVFCGAEHGSMKGTLIVLPVNNVDNPSSAPVNPDSGGGHEQR